MLMRLSRHVRHIADAMRAFLRARKLWAPRHAKIAVLYGSNPVLEPLFGEERYEVVDPDGESMYLDPRILFSALRHVIQMRRLTLGCVKAGQAIAVLERIKPAIVVTFIESAVFHMVSQRFRTARCLVIQDGGRTLDRDYPVGRSPQIYLREFACLGRYEIDEYSRYGARVETYYPIGSLKDAYYRARRVNGIALTKEFDLCVPSQFKPGAEFVHSERLDSFKVLMQHVRRFCESHQTTLCVPLRKHPDTDPGGYEWERAYLEGLLGTCAQVFPNVPGAYTTYDLVDRSRVSIGMHTTVLREGFGRGNRILSCNYSGNPVYTFPVPGPWTLTDPAYEVFEQRLLWLLGASQEEYSAVCGDRPSYLIAYDEKMPTHIFLQRLIADAVRGGAEPTPANA